MFKSVFGIVGLLFVLVAWLATPFGIGCAIYDYAFGSEAFGLALWFGFKVWIGMLMCVVPGFILTVICSD